MYFVSALAQRFATTIEVLCKAIALHGGLHRADMPVVEVAWHRLRRMLGRLDGLAKRFEAGEVFPVRAVRSRRVKPPVEAAAPAAPSQPVPPPPVPWGVEWEFGAPWGPPRPVVPPPPPPVRMPAGNGWLRRLTWTVNHLMPQVEQLLAHPDTLALAAATPQAGRLLRPLARMMGVTLPEALRLPKRVRKPKEPEPASPIVPRPEVPLWRGWEPVPQRLRIKWLKIPKRLREAPS